MSTHYEITKLRNEAVSAARAADLLEPISDKLDGLLSVTNLASHTSLMVNTREAVQAIMSLFPGRVWTKESNEGSINYRLTVDGHEYVINAYDGALPPTCRVEYVEETITRKRPVIRCGSNLPTPDPVPMPSLDHPTGGQVNLDRNADVARVLK